MGAIAPRAVQHLSLRAVTDHFAKLSQPHRPWLDDEQLKRRFQEMAAAAHPDTTGSADTAGFAALNAAYTTLRDPASRLHHLVQLQNPAALATDPTIPGDLTDCFMVVAEQQRVLREMAPPDESAPALVRAIAQRRSTQMEGEAREALAMLEAKYQEALAAVRDLDARWGSGDDALAREAIVLQSRLAYLNRWMRNIREMLLLFTLR